MVIKDSLKKPLENLQVQIVQAEQKSKELNTLASKLSNKIQTLEDSNTVMTESSAVLAAAASAARNNAKYHFEHIITNALQFVTQDKGYEFVIVDTSKTKASKPSYEFYVKSTINGTECLQKPEDANGGGFVDIISTAMKYAYLEIFNDPRIMSATLLYDEPAKMVSADMSVRFAEYVKFLGNHYGRQTIMITHNDALANVADKTFLVRKHCNGVSNVQEATYNETPLDTTAIKTLLEGDTDGNDNQD